MSVAVGAEKQKFVCEYCKEEIEGVVATLDAGYWDGAELHEGCACYLYKSTGQDVRDAFLEEFGVEDPDTYAYLRKHRQKEQSERSLEYKAGLSRLESFKESFEVVGLHEPLPPWKWRF
jgi:hypothetical protein